MFTSKSFELLWKRGEIAGTKQCSAIARSSNTCWPNRTVTHHHAPTSAYFHLQKPKPPELQNLWSDFHQLALCSCAMIFHNFRASVPRIVRLAKLIESHFQNISHCWNLRYERSFYRRVVTGCPEGFGATRRALICFVVVVRGKHYIISHFYAILQRSPQLFLSTRRIEKKQKMFYAI